MLTPEVSVFPLITVFLNRTCNSTLKEQLSCWYGVPIW